jgi:hypothetical protein
MSAYINEDLIPELDGTNFVISKVSKNDSSGNEYVLSEFKYKEDVIHVKFNHINPAKSFVGDCSDCGFGVTKAQYNGATWGDILVLGLGLGILPHYIKENKSPTSIDVVESDAEIISTVDWIKSGVNKIEANEWSYTPSKTYDIIIADLWAEPSDITTDQKNTLISNYSSHLKTGGKLIIPISGETIA